MEWIKEVELLRTKNLNEDELRDLCNIAIALFRQGKYEMAARFFILVHQKGFAREEISQTLLMSYYEPNLNALKEQYEKNIMALKKYPYMMEKDFPSFEALCWKVIPIKEEFYLVYNSEKGIFSEVCERPMEKDDKPFFQEVEKPLLIKNETNPWNLEYLCDNLRRSEDYGGDNHIYLYYELFDLFCSFLQIIDITVFLEDKKLVFIFGEQQLKKYYPLDFKGMFGINYDQFECRPIRIDELKRVCFHYPMSGASGGTFLLQIMDVHPDLLTIGHAGLESGIVHPDFGMFPYLYELVLRDKNPYEVLIRLKSKPFVQQILTKMPEGLDKNSMKRLLENKTSIIKCAVKLLNGEKSPTKVQWFKAFYLAYAYDLNRDFKGRIVPVLYYSPLWPQHFIIYSMMDVIVHFKHYTILSIVRDNCGQMGSDLQNHAISWKTSFPIQLLTEKIVNYYELYCMREKIKSFFKNNNVILDDHDIDKHVRMVRFEDLKLQSKATLTSICEFVDIPMSDTLFKCTDNGIVSGFDNGFNSAPIYKDRSKIIDDYDFYRFELISFNLYSAWGYKYKYYRHERYTREAIVEMFKDSFKIEEIERSWDSYDERRSSILRRHFLTTLNWYLSDETQAEIDRSKPINWLRPKFNLLTGQLYD